MSHLTDSRVVIDTPENLNLDAEVAGFSSRALAAIIDNLIVLAVMLVFFLITLRFVGTFNFNQTNLYAGLMFLLWFLLITFYHLFFEFTWNGQTPGKRRVGLRVVMSNGLPLTTNAAIVRNLVRLFDFFPFLYGAGLAVLFATPRTQRLGDLAASTIVIRERPRVTLDTLQQDWAVHYKYLSRYTPVPTYIDVARLSENDRRDIVLFLQRRDALMSKDYIVAFLAERIAAKIAFSEPGVDLRVPQQAERLLEYVARAFELNEPETSDSPESSVVPLVPRPSSPTPPPPDTRPPDDDFPVF